MLTVSVTSLKVLYEGRIARGKNKEGEKKCKNKSRGPWLCQLSHEDSRALHFPHTWQGYFRCVLL